MSLYQLFHGLAIFYLKNKTKPTTQKITVNASFHCPNKKAQFAVVHKEVPWFALFPAIPLPRRTASAV